RDPVLFFLSPVTCAIYTLSLHDALPIWIQSEFYKSYTTADGTFREDRYRNLQEKPLLSSHIIALIMKRDPAESVPAIEEAAAVRSEEHTSELQSRENLVCRLLLEKKK